MPGNVPDELVGVARDRRAMPKRQLTQVLPTTLAGLGLSNERNSCGTRSKATSFTLGVTGQAGEVSDAGIGAFANVAPKPEDEVARESCAVAPSHFPLVYSSHETERSKQETSKHSWFSSDELLWLGARPLRGRSWWIDQHGTLFSCT